MRVEVDFPQERIKYDTQHLLAGPYELSNYASGSVGIWSEPVNWFTMLQPVCFNDSWVTSNTSPYNKLPLSSFTQSSGTWETRTLAQFASGPWLSLSASSSGGGTIYTTGTYSKNRGIVLTCYNYSTSRKQNDQMLLAFGYGTATGSSQLYFELMGSGELRVKRAGELFFKDSITSADVKQGDKKEGEFYQLLVVPYNHNQILFFSQNGGSFVVTFDDITTADTDPTIAPSGSLFFSVPAGVGATMQIAPLTFVSSGYVYSDKLNFTRPPANGLALDTYYNPSWIGSKPYRIIGYPAYVGTQSATAIPTKYDYSTFTADGSSLNARIKATLSTNNTGYSPTLVGAQVSYVAVTGSCASGTQDITKYIQKLTLDVPENPSDVKLSLTLTEVASAVAQVPRLDTMLNRPIRLFDSDDTIIFNGKITGLRKTLSKANLLLDIEARDNWVFLDEYIFRDRLTLADSVLSSSIGFLADKGFCQSTNEITSGLVVLPFASDKEIDNWGKTISVGDSASKVLIDLMDTFANNWIYGYGPNASGYYHFFAKSPDDLPTSGSPGYTLYDDNAAAVAASALSSDVFWSFSSELIAPEATEARVTGFDPKTKAIIQSFKIDSDAEDITLAPADRPDNWVGGQLAYGYIDPALTSKDLVDYSTELMYSRVTQTRYLGEWDSKYLKKDAIAPIWKGDCVHLVNYGYYRVVALRLEWESVINGEDITSVSYTGEEI